MKCTFLSFSTLLGIISLLRQASLSLHRSVSIDELNRFYEGSRNEMLNRIQVKLESMKIYNVSSLQLFMYNLISLIMKQGAHKPERMVCLPYNLVLLCKTSVNKFYVLLKTENQVLISDKNELRIELDVLAKELSRFVFNKSAVKSTNNVVHLGQADHLSLKSIKEIAGDDWFL